MSALDVIHRVRAAGGTICVVGDYLELEAPAPLPSDLVQEIKAHKAAILAALGTAKSSATVIPFAPRRVTVPSGRTVEGAEIRRSVKYNYDQMREDGMACCDWCLKCKRNGGNCKRADLREKPHRCQEFEPDHGRIE